MKDIFSGFIAAPFSPLDADGKVNLEVIKLYYIYLRRKGIKGVFVNGTAGEGLSLSTQARMAILAEWLKSADEDFSVIAHITHLSFPETIKLLNHARQAGAVAAGVTAPNFFKPVTLEDLVDFIADVAAEEPDLPLLYYHIPSKTGANFPMLRLLELVDGRIPNFAGIKYSHNDMADLSLCLDYKDGKYPVLSGCEQNFLYALLMGGKGTIGGSFSFMAKIFMEIKIALKKSDILTATKLQVKADKILKFLLEKGSFQAAGKAIMRDMGIDLGKVLLPLHSYNAAEEKEIVAAYKKLL